MATPLKALLQERLRAKIVRQGDEEEAAADASDSSLTKAAPKIDPCEYTVPPSVAALARARSYAAGSVHPASELLRFNEDLEQFRSDRAHGHGHRSARPLREDEATLTAPDRFDSSRRQVESGMDPHGFQLVSPVRSNSGNKRAWHELPNELALAHNDEHAHYRQRPVREVQGDEHSAARRPASPRSSEHMPRKNYDLSSAYQRYRELSSKRGCSPDVPVVMDRDASQHSPSDMARYIESPSVDDASNHVPSRRGRPLKSKAQRPTRSMNPLRIAARPTPALHTTREDKADADVEVGAPHYTERRERYPVVHITPTYRQLAVPPGVGAATRRGSSPRVFSHFFGSYTNYNHGDENKIVFHSVARAAPGPRSPCHRQFLRQEVADADAEERVNHYRSLDDRLSPESHQAARAFVEKRQKRSKQGTPRTMATHRWLQSMVDAQQTHRHATTTTVPTSLQGPRPQCPSEAAAFSESPHLREYDHEKLPANTAAVPPRPHYHDTECDPVRHRHALFAVFSPSRPASAHSFFSSAV